MISGVPNMAYVFGYFRHSWTLRVDLVSDLVGRLLAHMHEEGATMVVPRLRPTDADMELRPWSDPENFKAGYVMRSQHILFKQGDREPWTHMLEYAQEREFLPKADLDDGTLVYKLTCRRGSRRGHCTEPGSRPRGVTTCTTLRTCIASTPSTRSGPPGPRSAAASERKSGRSTTRCPGWGRGSALCPCRHVPGRHRQFTARPRRHNDRRSPQSNRPRIQRSRRRGPRHGRAGRRGCGVDRCSARSQALVAFFAEERDGRSTRCATASRHRRSRGRQPAG